MNKQPIRLEDDPIMEAIFEIRFQGGAPSLADLLPGLLYPHLKDRFPTVESLPISQVMPRSVQEADPELRYQPRNKLAGKDFIVLLGDHLAAISSPRPYTGWPKFRAFILELITLLKGTDILGSIERFSVKYVNLLPSNDLPSQFKMVNFSALLGGHDLTQTVTHVHTNFLEDKFMNFIEMASNANVRLANGESHFGLLLTIDVVSTNTDNFLAQPEDSLDAAHQLEKNIFYKILTEQAVEQFKPVWS